LIVTIDAHYPMVYCVPPSAPESLRDRISELPDSLDLGACDFDDPLHLFVTGMGPPSPNEEDDEAHGELEAYKAEWREEDGQLALEAPVTRCVRAAVIMG
jgi:hypothetical protein